MQQTCPHCFARVLVTSNRICPSCTVDVTLPCTHNLTAITVSPSTSFDQICHACGRPATRKTKVQSTLRSEYYVEDEYQGLRIFVAIFSTLFLPVSVLFGRRDGVKATYHGLRLLVPCCDDCRNKEVQIVEADVFGKTMRIAVHNKLASAMESQHPIATYRRR